MPGPIRPPAIVVAVHDVAPATLAEVRWLLSRLDAIGATPRSLLVVPMADGHADLRRDPETCDLLRAEVGVGSELVLHGFTHRKAGPWLGGLSSHLRARAFAPDDAEFLSLTPAAAAARLGSGRRIVAEAVGVTPAAFCAPAWLGGPRLGDVLAEQGFRVEVGMATITDVSRGRRIPAPSIGYLGAGRLREALPAIGGLAGLAVSVLPPVSAVQVFLHPREAPRSRACARVLRLLELLLRRLQPTTYERLVG